METIENLHRLTVLAVNKVTMEAEEVFDFLAVGNYEEAMYWLQRVSDRVATAQVLVNMTNGAKFIDDEHALLCMFEKVQRGEL